MIKEKTAPAPTAIAAAFLRAGYSAERDRAWVRAKDILADVHGDMVIARRRLNAILDRDQNMRDAVTDFFLAVVKSDISGTNLLGQGQLCHANSGPWKGAQSRQFNSETMAITAPPDDVANINAPLSCSPDECGGGQQRHADKGHGRSAAPHSADGGATGQLMPAETGRLSDARKRSPSAAQKAANRAAMATNARDLTILDTYKIMDGRLLRDIAWGKLASLEGASMRQGFIIRMIRQHAQVSDNATLVGDVITASTLQVILQQAAGMQDAFSVR